MKKYQFKNLFNTDFDNAVITFSSMQIVPENSDNF